MNEPERSLDPQLWHACAGGMVQMPTVNSRVFYFPQGHAEHASSVVDFASSSQIPPLILCRVSSVKFLADPESDEVFAKLKLAPLPSRELLDLQEDNVFGLTGSDNLEKPASFAKTLTQSDANNGGGFSVPRYCAETIFPRLDYSADPPVQTVVAKDVHGETWKFRHIYRGTPRRHLLTTGWSTFVNQKKLVAGDSIVFLRADNGELCVGIRRAKRGTGGDSLAVWSSSGSSGGGGGSFVPQFGGFSMLFREEESKLMRSTTNAAGCDPGFRGRGRVRPETVIEAATLAASGQPFEVVYYPRASTPEFCVKAASVKAAMRIHWCSGMRFKMAFETEDSSRISWFMGTISSVHVMDPIRWPNSPWRLLQVTWDEPDLLQNVKRVSPWLVELVSNIPAMHVPSFSPPRKKLRLPQYPDFQLDGNSMFPSLPGNLRGQTNLLCCLSDNAPARIQGARQGQFGIPLTDHHLNNRLRLGLLSSSLHHLDPHFRNTNSIMKDNTQRSESLMLTMGNSSQNLEKSGNQKNHKFLLFGQPILTEQQLANGCAADVVSKVVDGRSSSNGSMSKLKFLSDGLGSTLKEVGASFPWRCGFDATELSQETSHCKVFMESEDVGRTLDLSVLGSYEELYRKLANMFGIERSEMPSHVLYRDAAGTVRRTGDEPFSDFMRTAKRLTIFMDSGSHNIGRTLLTGMRSAENGFDSSTKAGPLSTFA